MFPPKAGIAYHGNPKNFILGSSIEGVMHGLTDVYGNPIWEPIPGDDCYRVTIDSTIMPYLILRSEVLCKPAGKAATISEAKWITRCQLKRFTKKKFKELVISGILKKTKAAK